VKGEHTRYLPSHAPPNTFARAADPTPEEIAARAAEVRAGWGLREWLRAVGARRDDVYGWTPPLARRFTSRGVVRDL
jgi:hypothetical protein